MAIAFGWIALAFCLVQTWFFARWIRGEPRFAAFAEMGILPSVFLLLVMGLPAAWRLIGDRRWLLFLHTRGLRPSSVLMSFWLERFVRSSAGVAIVGSYACALHSARPIDTAAGLLLFVIGGSLLLGMLQVLIVLASRAFSGTRHVRWLAAACLLTASVYLLAQLGRAQVGSASPGAVLEVLCNHPLIRWAGFADLVQLACLTPGPSGALIRVAVRLGIGGIAGWLILRFRFERLGRQSGADSWLAAVAGKPARVVLRATSVGWLAHGCLEFLLLIRQGSVVVALWTFGALVVLAAIRTSPDGAGDVAAALPFVALLAAHGIGADGIQEMLGRRSPFRLYRAWGVDPGDYGGGLAFAASCLAILALAAWLPLLHGVRAWHVGAASAGGAALLGAADAAFATLISLYLYPILPGLGIVGQIKSGLILIGSAWLMIVLFSAHPILPISFAFVCWRLKKPGVAAFIWRRIWNADPV